MEIVRLGVESVEGLCYFIDLLLNKDRFRLNETRKR